MQNIIKLSKLLLLVVALLTITTICNFDSVTAKTNEKLIYQKFLRKEYKKPYSGNGVKRGFYLINLDGKGTQELILTRGESGGTGNSTFYVYSIKNKKVKQIGGFLHRSNCRFFEYNKKGKTIRAETGGNGYLQSCRWLCKNNKLKPEFVCFDEQPPFRKDVLRLINIKAKWNINGWITGNDHNGKSVSKARYNKYYKQHYSSIKWKKYYMKELTLSNINVL